jgi:TonB-linked SusC/RagA family outer membrane protein
MKKKWLVFGLGYFIFISISCAAFGQTVSGTVTDAATSNPLPGVNILVVGTSTGTATDANGHYSMNVPSLQDTLRFSFIGYKTQMIPINGKKTINVSLKSSVISGKQLVVTALGIKQQKRALGSSVATVSSQEINRVPHGNVLTSLQGKVAGVTIDRTGGVGSSVSMVIRGAISLNSDNQPLIVVDGVPIANSLNNITKVGTGNGDIVDFGNAISSINPENIKSISILKGPSAAALYGSRAGNGVVLITTKNGSNVNKMTVTVNSNTMANIPYKYLQWQDKFASGQFPAIPVSISHNPLTNPFQQLIDQSSHATAGAELDKGYKAVQWNSPLDKDGNPIPIPLVSHPNNIRDFVQRGFTTQNSISVANNTNFIRYRVSYSNMRHSGIIPNTDLFKNSLNLNTSLKINSKLRLSTNIDVSRNSSNNRPTKGKMSALHWAYMVGPEVDINDLRDYWEPGLKGLQQITQSNGEFNNPWFIAYEVHNRYKRDRIHGGLKLNWQILPSLSLMLRYGLDTYNGHRKLEVPYSAIDNPRGALDIENLKSFESNANFLATYKKNLKNFSIKVSGGGNIRYQSFNSVLNSSKGGGGLIVPGVYTIQNILPKFLNFNSHISKRQVNSVYGLATLGFKDMMYLHLSGRNDWASTLPNAQPYFYPSASLSLLINDIAGITSNNINLIKLRGGISQVGNAASPYQLVNVLQNAGTWNGVPELSTSNTLLTPNLKPEKITSYEGGVDVHLFRNRLHFSGTYYMEQDKNQIFTTKIPSSSGYRSKNINAGLVRSRGIETTLGFTPFRNTNWNWDVNVNLTRNRTKIVRLAPEMPFFTFWEEVNGGAWTYAGDDVGDIYGSKIRTVTDKSSPYYGWPLLSIQDGGAKWQPINAHNTRNMIGNFNPKFIMGLNTTLSYKNWSLSMTFDWRNGGDFISQTYRYGMEHVKAALQFKQFINPPGNLKGKQLSDYLKAHANKYIKIHGNHFPRVGWPVKADGKYSYPFHFSGFTLPYSGLIIPGVFPKGFDTNGNPTGYIENLGENILDQDSSNPNYTLPVPYAAVDPWDFPQAFLFPSSYIKLRQVTLTFHFPERWIKGLDIQELSLSLYSKNIMLWTKAKIGIDPERAFQQTTGDHGGSQFEQGIELYNVRPWVMPIGVKLHVSF